MRRAVTAVTLVPFVLALVISCVGAGASDDAHTVPVIDGGVGPCTADFTISDPDGKPLYDAKIRVHIAYGFMSARKLDLEVGSNIDGKARFTGLPNRSKHGFYFSASQGELQGEAFDDPANNCKAQFSLTLRKMAQ